MLRRGPTLHAYALGWVGRYAGSGRDSVRENTRREYQRLLAALGGLRPPAAARDLRACVPRPLRARARSRPRRRRGGRAWEVKERPFLTREELGRLLDEIPARSRPLFDLLVVTGLRISEAIALRFSDLVLDARSPRLRVSRAIVRRVANAPRSRHGARVVPLPHDLAATLRTLRPPDAAADALVFPGRDGSPADVGSLRGRVLVPAAERAGLSEVGFHTLRHTCASLLIKSGMNVLRLQRWMGHHSPAFTLETYGHLLDGDLGPPLDLHAEVRPARARGTAP